MQHNSKWLPSFQQNGEYKNETIVLIIVTFCLALKTSHTVGELTVYFVDAFTT